MEMYHKESKGVLFQGDSLEILNSLIKKDFKCDLIATDPPYKMTSRGGVGNTGGMLLKASVRRGDVFKFNTIKIEEWLPLCYELLKETGHCYIMTNHKNLHHYLNVAEKTGFHFIKSLIWNKGNKIMGTFYMSQFEYILFFRKGKGVRINNCGTPDILNIPNKKTKNEEGKNIHDTEKPVDLMKILIENSSNEKDVVLDPFVGVGSALLASKILNRKYIGIEIDEEYCKITSDRLKDVDV